MPGIPAMDAHPQHAPLLRHAASRGWLMHRNAVHWGGALVAASGIDLDQFSALRSDGSVVSWGNSAPSDATPSVLSSGVAQLVRSNLALMDDGSFVVFNKDNVSHNTSPIPLIGLNNSLTCS